MPVRFFNIHNSAFIILPLLVLPGCQPTAGSPTTQQVISSTEFAQTAEDLVVAGLELGGVIKTKNDARANLLQAAVNAATAKYEADLTAGFSQAQALVDAGNAIAFVHVVDMILENTDATNTLTIGGGTNAVTWLPSAGVPVPPGGALVLHAPSGQAITAGSTDQLQVATSGGTNVAYNLTIAGRSL
jgi:hypothetical protein